MIGVVLCAGRGSRLGSLTEEIPKTLLPVGGDRTILDTIFDGLSGHVEHVMIVAGHRSEILRDVIQDRVNTSIVVVEDVDKWNNARSLWTALQSIDDDVFVANGDTVVHPTATAAFIDNYADCSIALSVDTSQTLGWEAMKVTVDELGRVGQISKTLEPATSQGEYIGQSIIVSEAIPAVTDALEQAWSQDANSYYEDGYQVAIDAGLTVRHVALAELGWTEVDDRSDLRAARALSWL